MKYNEDDNKSEFVTLFGGELVMIKLKMSIEDIKKYTNIFMETLIEVCQRHQTSIYIDDIKYIEKYLAELENGGN